MHFIEIVKMGFIEYKLLYSKTSQKKKKQFTSLHLCNTSCVFVTFYNL